MTNDHLLVISLFLLLGQAVIFLWYASIFMIRTEKIKIFFPFALIGITRAYAAAFFVFELTGNPIWIWAGLESINVFALFWLLFSFQNE